MRMLGLFFIGLCLFTSCSNRHATIIARSGVTTTMPVATSQTVVSSMTIAIPEKAVDLTGLSSVTVIIEDNSFSERIIVVSPGTVITWVNEGRNTHNVTPAAKNLEPGWFPPLNEDLLFPQGSATLTFDELGAYPYYCTFHGTATRGQTGQVIVRNS